MTRASQELQVYVTPDMLDELNALSSAMRISRSELVRTACTHYIEARQAQQAEAKPEQTNRVKPTVGSRKLSEYARGEREGGGDG